jgi:hypothetical protein
MYGEEQMEGEDLSAKNENRNEAQQVARADKERKREWEIRANGTHGLGT